MEKDIKTDTGIIAQFKIYPTTTRSLYYVVRVFRTKKKMVEYGRATGISISRRTTAQCSTYVRQHVCGNGKMTTLKEIGALSFYRRKVGMSIVTHECCHAAMFWLKKVMRRDTIIIDEKLNGKTVTGDEEKICEVVGHLSRQVAVALWDNGVWK